MAHARGRSLFKGWDDGAIRPTEYDPFDPATPLVGRTIDFCPQLAFQCW